MNIRHEILRGAADGATVDDLIERTGLDRPKLKSNLDAAIADGLITRHKDEVTGLPAYQLTAAGRERLAAGPARKTAAADAQPEVASNAGSDGSAVSSVTTPAEAIAVHANPAAEVAPPATSAAADDGEIERMQRLFYAAIRDLAAIAEHIGLDPEEGGAVPIIEAFDELRDQRDRLEAQRDAWREAIGAITGQEYPEAACANIADLYVEINHLIARLAEARGMADVPDAGYVVAAPKRPLRRVGKFDTARKLALAAARNGSGRGEVFALVPVGRAVRGAEWREA